jgi:hypothetical protein
MAPLDVDGLNERGNEPPAPRRHRIGRSGAEPLLSRRYGANVTPEWLCCIESPIKSLAASLKRVELISKAANTLTADLFGRRPVLKRRQAPVS